MAEFPHMPLSTDAYLADTTHLRPIEHGVYLMLLMVAWRMPGTPRLPNDDRLLAKYAGVNRSTWVSMRETILAFWQLGDDGFLTQKKQLKVHQHVQKVSREAREKSAKRWGPKPLKDNVTGDAAAYADDMPEGMQPKPYTSYTPKVPKGGKSAAKGYGDETDPLFADFNTNVWLKRWQRKGHVPLDAFRAYARLTAAQREACKTALPGAARSIVASASEEKYRPMLASWINRRGWEADAGAKTTSSGPDWQAWITAFKTDPANWIATLGPRPGEPGCRVPREFLVGLVA